ncbi:MAG: glycosyltransferase family 2 protein [Lachnospiraceae bacterium]|nr:glycosyltransferase family 2 protein [Lachnospiraceae bacterium]
MENQEKLAVVICNYNKGARTIDCIQSVLSSHHFVIGSNLKIFVVDNASTDGSAAIIAKKYGNKISFTRSDVDLGSGGGLNLGMKQALSEGFRYICCMGEDVTAEPDALKAMLDFMVTTPSVGLAGGKIYHKHMPHYIQHFGMSVDFRHFKASTLYADTPDSENIPNLVYCDAISGCCMMVRAEAIEKAGLMPTGNFLYWDDTEWGYRIKQSGFEVVALGDAKFYHSANPMHRCDNTKVNYYTTRNGMHFFMKYTKPEDCTRMSIVLLRSVFEAFYLHRMGNAHNMAQSDIAALLDAVSGVRGKAADNRILDNDETGLGFVNFFEEQEAVYMEDDDPFLEQVIRQVNPDIVFMQLPCADAVTIVRCDSILGIKDFHFSLEYSENVIYIDKNYKMLSSREDMNLIKNYEPSLQLFLYAMQPAVLQRIAEMRHAEFHEYSKELC